MSDRISAYDILQIRQFPFGFDIAIVFATQRLIRRSIEDALCRTGHIVEDARTVLRAQRGQDGAEVRVRPTEEAAP